MKNPSTLICVVAVSTFLTGTIIGCTESRSQRSEQQEKRIPRQKFHLPKTYSKGVSRLRELFDVVVADGDLPEPINYQVLEIIHGTGAAAHSHYHLLEGTNDQKFDDDGHETTGEAIHNIEVEWNAELIDLAKWLPKIAVGGDMDEQSWLKVRDLSSDLSKEFEKLIGDSVGANQKRETIRSSSETLSNLIAELEKLEPQTSRIETDE